MQSEGLRCFLYLIHARPGRKSYEALSSHSHILVPFLVFQSGFAAEVALETTEASPVLELLQLDGTAGILFRNIMRTLHQQQIAVICLLSSRARDSLSSAAKVRSGLRAMARRLYMVTLSAVPALVSCEDLGSGSDFSGPVSNIKFLMLCHAVLGLPFGRMLRSDVWLMAT